MTAFAATYLALSSLAYLCLLAWHHGSRADVLGHDTKGKGAVIAGASARRPGSPPACPDSGRRHQRETPRTVTLR